MIPLRDINPVRSTPIVNYLLILANIGAYLYMNSLPPWYETGYSLVPTRLFADPLGEAFTIFTSMFMHANLAHIAGNLWFLWIFGDNVEDAMGHGRYLLFYLLGGVVAAAVQMIMTMGSPVPMVGASGAIAAVVGAYVLLYPRAPILILNPIPLLWLFWGISLIVPAWFVAGEFFIVNALMGVQSLGAEGASGGVAVFAHIGGFIAGLVAVSPLTRGREKSRHRTWEGWRPPARR
ncbi:MAG TPA: rhomboid family intramembrane serine protease [Polyangiaceae bacterium]|nr:rhomboid family intramembrane serine protease [Polyangiaceae bacterium]